MNNNKDYFSTRKESINIPIARELSIVLEHNLSYHVMIRHVIGNANTSKVQELVPQCIILI